MYCETSFVPEHLNIQVKHLYVHRILTGPLRSSFSSHKQKLEFGRSSEEAKIPDSHPWCHRSKLTCLKQFSGRVITSSLCVIFALYSDVWGNRGLEESLGTSDLKAFKCLYRSKMHVWMSVSLFLLSAQRECMLNGYLVGHFHPLWVWFKLLRLRGP